jgi:hypothetical protein
MMLIREQDRARPISGCGPSTDRIRAPTRLPQGTAAGFEKTSSDDPENLLMLFRTGQVSDTREPNGGADGLYTVSKKASMASR